MNISARLLHRSLASSQPPTSPAGTDLSHYFTTFLYNDVDYDSKSRFAAEGSNTSRHRKGVNCAGADETEGRWVVTGGADGSLVLWDLEQDDREHTIKAWTSVSKKDRPSHGITSIRFNPNEASLFATTSYSASLSLFNIGPTGASLMTAFPFDCHLYTHSISSASASALVAVAGSSPHIRLIDPRTSSTTQTLFGHISSVLNVAWSPLYSSILASGGHDGSLRIWDIRFGASCLGTLDATRAPQMANRAAGKAHEGGVNKILWTVDGRRVISAGMDNKIRVWNMESGYNSNVVFPPVFRNKYQAEFPMVLTEPEDSRRERLWVASEEQLLAFDVEDGRMLKRLRIPKGDIRDGIGRITGLVERKGTGQLYTSHAAREGTEMEVREGVMRWRSAWLREDDEEIIVEKTEKQKVLEKIFEKMTKEPVRFT